MGLGPGPGICILKHPKRWAKIQLLQMPEDTEDPSPLAVMPPPGQKVEGLEAD